MTVPSDKNIALKEIEKKSKYKDIELEIQRIFKKVLEAATVTEIQKICMLGSARILRRVLTV